MNVLVEEQSLQDIADAIREKTETEDTFLPSEMGEAIRGISSGGSDSYYDTFWDAYQQNGERTDYPNAFSDGYFNKENFKPKYDIVPTNAGKMFSGFPDECDLREILKECGVTLDLSKTGSNYVFSNSHFTALPTIVANSTIYGWFSGCTKLHTIEKLVLNRNMNDTQLNGLGNCTALQNMIVEGEIAYSFYIKHSPLLSDASVQSIIDCLIDLTGQTSQTVTWHSVIIPKLTDEQIIAMSNKNWQFK